MSFFNKLAIAFIFILAGFFFSNGGVGFGILALIFGIILLNRNF